VSVGTGFARAATESRYVVYACAVLHDHAHLVLCRHERTLEMMTAHLKSFATRQLRGPTPPFECFVSPDGAVPCAWAEGLWKVFLLEEGDILRAFRYVNDNPARENLPAQQWDFVSPFFST
jgi:hypothetical protein